MPAAASTTAKGRMPPINAYTRTRVPAMPSNYGYLNHSQFVHHMHILPSSESSVSSNASTVSSSPPPMHVPSHHQQQQQQQQHPHHLHHSHHSHHQQHHPTSHPTQIPPQAHSNLSILTSAVNNPPHTTSTSMLSTTPVATQSYIGSSDDAQDISPQMAGDLAHKAFKQMLLHLILTGYKSRSGRATTPEEIARDLSNGDMADKLRRETEVKMMGAFKMLKLEQVGSCYYYYYYYY
jgi:hypothetical protein